MFPSIIIQPGTIIFEPVMTTGPAERAEQGAYTKAEAANEKPAEPQKAPPAGLI